MLNVCQKTKRESHPAFFGSSPQLMSFMRLQRLHIQIVEVYRQKFLQNTGEANRTVCSNTKHLRVLRVRATLVYSSGGNAVGGFHLMGFARGKVHGIVPPLRAHPPDLVD